MPQPLARVLVVDDESSIRHFLRVSLRSHGYSVSEAVCGQEALAILQSGQMDVLILDLGLPDMDGIDVARRVRKLSQIPIIVLSVRERESDKIAALDAGADDYLTKPFGVGELLARVRVALRRAAPVNSESVFVTGDLKVDLARRVVAVGEKDIQLTPTEFDLLRVLALHAGKVMTHRQLLALVWGGAYENEIHLLRVNISNLRRRIESDPTEPRYILTEPGVGYRLSETD